MTNITTVRRVEEEVWTKHLPPRAPLKAKILRILETNRLASEYQPIVDIESGESWGYEALARFSVEGKTVAPNLVFRSLHNDPTLFFLLESRLKAFQIEHRPGNAKLFLNLDPDVCEEDYQLRHWVSLFAAQSDVVVEIIENTTISNVETIKHFAQALAGNGIRIALDDVGGRHNLFSFDLLNQTNFLKFDRRWLNFLREDPNYKLLIRGILDFANARNIQSILEGVETKADLEVARQLGVHFVQGYLFKEQFITVSNVPTEE